MPNSVSDLIRTLLLGRGFPTGLGTNVPAEMGANPVRGLPTPDFGGQGFFPGARTTFFDAIQQLIPYLSILAPFIQGNVSFGTRPSIAGGTAGTAPGQSVSSPGGGDVLTQALPLLSILIPFLQANANLGAAGGSAVGSLLPSGQGAPSTALSAAPSAPSAGGANALTQAVTQALLPPPSRQPTIGTALTQAILQGLAPSPSPLQGRPQAGLAAGTPAPPAPVVAAARVAAPPLAVDTVRGRGIFDTTAPAATPAAPPDTTGPTLVDFIQRILGIAPPTPPPGPATGFVEWEEREGKGPSIGDIIRGSPGGDGRDITRGPTIGDFGQPGDFQPGDLGLRRGQAMIE